MMEGRVRPTMWVAGCVAVLACGLAGTPGIRAGDWPEHRGKGDLGVWNETGIVETFPPGGLPVRWRVLLQCGGPSPGAGYGRLFVARFGLPTHPRGVEADTGLG